MAVVISGLFCIIVGLALGVGGAKVISLGGTWYFAILAAGFLLTGVLLLMRRSASADAGGVALGCGGHLCGGARQP